MLSIYQDFIDLKNHDLITMANQNFNYILSDCIFTFYSVCSQECLIRLNDYTNTNKLIIIDEYEYSNDSYYIVCFDMEILIIRQFEIVHLFDFFSKNRDSLIFFISHDMNNSIHRFNDYVHANFLRFYSNENENSYLLRHLSLFKEKFSVKIRENDSIKLNNANAFWKIINRSIAGYLFFKSKLKKKFDRYNFYELQNSLNEIVLNKNEIIDLGPINNEYFSKIKLIYHIKKEELFIVKSFVDENAQKLFQREKDNYLKIHHPFLLHYYGIYEDNSYDSLIIEYIDGVDLLSIQKLKLKDNEKLKIIFEILLAISYLHKNNFIYRDLKPNNIIIDQNKTAVLIDYDQMVISNNVNSTCNFSHEFIAPEIISKGSCSFKSDVYSLGALIYFIILEKTPPVNENNVIILEKNIFPSNLKGLEEIMQKCIQIDPDKRPSISDMFIMFLEFYFREIISLYYESLKKLFMFLYICSANDYSQAHFELGKFHYEGSVVQKNINTAYKYFLLGANQNHAGSQYYLGFIYLNEIEYFDIYKAIYYFTLASNQKVTLASHTLGLIYYENKYIQRDINKAIYFFSISAEKNYVYSQLLLGKIFLENKYVARDINKAINYFTLAANQNDLSSQYNLGLIYLDGKYVAQNIEKSIYYLSLAANQNHTESQFILGGIFVEGKLISRDINKAIYYYTLAANQNHAESQYNLGVVFGEGKLISRDINKSIYYLTLSANNSYAKAQFNLACNYLKGQYTPKDIDKGIYYLTLATNQNFSEAQCNLGLVYYIYDDVPVDINKAIYYLSLAAKQNHAQAQFNLGKIYYDNKYIKRNIGKSIYYFTLASNQNHTESHIYIGNIYYLGEYIPVNMEKAIYYFTLAAKNNDSFSQNRLGNIFYFGLNNTLKDIKKALYYFDLAAKNNDQHALSTLGAIYLEGIYVNFDLNKAINYLTQASNQNNTVAHYNLGNIYLHDDYKIKDINKAIHYFELAANNSDSLAQQQLVQIYANPKYNHIDLEKAFYYLQRSKTEDPVSQWILGLHLYETSTNQYRINEGINLLIQSSNQYFDYAQFTLGFIYQYGKKIKNDIKKAITFYKYASSFNNQFAKNNLGVIYKNGVDGIVDQNFGAAKIYFDEAIHQKNDYVSMYNLALIYIFELKDEEYFNKSIKLLIKSAEKGFSESLELLCIIFVKKFGENISNLQNEIKKYNDVTDTLFENILKMIKVKKLNIPSYLINRFKYHQDNDFIYDYHKIPISVRSIKIKNKNPINNLDDLQKLIASLNKPRDITESFYEGFGCDLF